MAYRSTIDLVSSNGTTYASAEEFVTAHGPCGTLNETFVSEATMTLLDGGNGVRVVMTYADEATATAHRASSENAYDSLADLTNTVISNETV